MEIKSNLLGTNLQVEETEDGLFIITHDTLRKLVKENPRLSVKCTALKLETDMCVFEAEAKDNSTGVVITEIGESNALNLKSDIAKENPAIMAQYRAYDRALIQLLDLPVGKIYSNNEINKPKYKKSAATNVESTVPTTVSENENVVKISHYVVRPDAGGFEIYDEKKEDCFRRADGSKFLYSSIDAGVAALNKYLEKKGA